MLIVTPSIRLQPKEIKEIFTCASGPGGQNVNKVSTAVQLRFDVKTSASLTRDIKIRLKRLAGRRMTADGVLVIHAERFRSQEKNRQDARQRLMDLIRQAAEPPRKRKKTRPTAASRQRRLEQKHRRSRVKQLRKVFSEP